MNFKAVLTIAAAVLLFGSFAGVQAAETGPQSGVQNEAQATPATETPEPDAPATVTCPNCGADCPMPYGRRARGMRAPRAHKGGHGRHQSGYGHARRGGFGGGTGVPADRMLRGATGLELSEAQVTQLEKLSYDTKSKLIDLESSLEKARLEMRRQMESDGDDLSAMKKQLDSMAKTKVDIQELKLKNWIDAKKVLTDEQKQKVKDHSPRFGAHL
jgi:Spy/CpxP family protein refolding chaperone